MNEFLITTIVSISLALIGYFVKYFNDLRIAKNNAELELKNEKMKFELSRINQQLQYFYGPLKSLNETGSIAYKGFSDQYLDTNYLEAKYGISITKKPETGDTERVNQNYRIWMMEVFIPMHDIMMDTILSRLDLLIEDELPECLELVCAHVASYKPILKKWKDGDYTETAGVIYYPSEQLSKYLSTSFVLLKKRQRELLEQIEN